MTEKQGWKCGECENTNGEASKFCGECGSKRQPMSSRWECGTCRTLNEDASKFCRECGNKRQLLFSRWECGECKTLNGNASKFCGECGIKRQSMPSSWKCGKCKSVNKEIAKFCVECGNTRQVMLSGTDKRKNDGIDINERRLVLIGKTSSGKSTTGNNILGRKEFRSRVTMGSVTKECAYKSVDRHGKKIVIVDTPGFFDTEMSDVEITKEIVRCVNITSPGPHAFLLTLKIGRFTDEKQTVKKIAEIFGEGMYKYVVIVFTYADLLERENMSIQNYLQNSKQFLSLVKKCNNLYICFNNIASPEKIDTTVKELIDMIEDVLTENGNSCYPNKMYEEAEAALKIKTEQF